MLHTAAALEELFGWLEKLTGGALRAMAVALEVPCGPLVETLLERGLTVFSLTQNNWIVFATVIFPRAPRTIAAMLLC